MPQIFDLFGFPVADRSDRAELSRKLKLCPFMDAVCDGGGNRNQTKIKLSGDSELRDYFDPSVHDVIPGICSILAAGDAWVVCPRRLLAFKNDLSSPPKLNSNLQPYERDLLIAAGTPKGVPIGVWSEVYLKLSDDEGDINYHFDYIVAPMLQSTIQNEARRFRMSDSQMDALIADAKRVGLVARGERSPAACPVHVPDLSSPLVIEVMTASTSGSDTEAGTDIRSAFRDAIMGRGHEAPGINKRQVWGRMVTQLFAKTALTSGWGGKTVWVIQDELLKNIELTTRLKVSLIQKHASDNISLAVMHYEPDAHGRRTTNVAFKRSAEGDAGVSFHGSDTYTDILLPGRLPEKYELLRAILRRPLAASLTL